MSEFMRAALPLALAVAAGLALGLGFFGGLWWTVRKGMASAKPARWFLGSALLRTGVVLAGLCWFALHFPDPHRLLACLAGFGLAQWLALRLPRLPAPIRRAHGPGDVP